MTDTLFIVCLKLCVKMVFTSREKAFVYWSMLEQTRKIGQRTFVKKFSKKSPTANLEWARKICMGDGYARYAAACLGGAMLST